MGCPLGFGTVGYRTKVPVETEIETHSAPKGLDVYFDISVAKGTAEQFSVVALSTVPNLCPSSCKSVAGSLKFTARGVVGIASYCKFCITGLGETNWTLDTYVEMWTGVQSGLCA
jgi:hypothetical protein